jgi:DNA-binding beta-propeller fold protein YncE
MNVPLPLGDAVTGGNPYGAAAEGQEIDPMPRHLLARPARSTALLALLLAAGAGTAAGSPELTAARVVASGPSDVPFHSPRGIAIDTARGEVLVANSGAHRIEIFDLEGRRRGHHVHRVRDGQGDLIAGVPVALAVDAAGRTLVVDNAASYVDVLDFRGRTVARLELAAGGDGGAVKDSPGSVAVTPAGEILVGTRGASGRVYRFGADYRPLGRWGEPGTGPGRLSGITGLAPLPDGRVVVTCMNTGLAVQIFSAAGEYVQGFGVHDVGPGNFSFPSGVAVTADGRIWVSDEIRQIIQVFDFAGRFLGTVGGGGVAPGEFQYPSALASDGGACLAVTERVGNRFQLLRIRPADAHLTLTESSTKGR